jgi:putative ABC transport system permease protein
VGVAGAILLLGFSGLAVGADAVTISFTPSLRLALTGLAAAVATGLLAGLAPAWQAARSEIVPALRQA